MDKFRFISLTENARLIRSELHEIISKMNGQVHFRPGVDGISMISLLSHSPQMGLSKIPNIKTFKTKFDDLFERHCRQVAPIRLTPEKELQSYLIALAYRHPQRLLPFDSLDLMFVTDEIPVYMDKKDKKVVCDILAISKKKNGYAPVLVELKSSREKKRLIEQVSDYAPVIDANIEKYSNLFSALLGKRIELVGPCEKWIVWPAIWDTGDPRTKEFASLGIGVITYTKNKKPFKFLTSIPS